MTNIEQDLRSITFSQCSCPKRPCIHTPKSCAKCGEAPSHCECAFAPEPRMGGEAEASR